MPSASGRQWAEPDGSVSAGDDDLLDLEGGRVEFLGGWVGVGNRERDGLSLRYMDLGRGELVVLQGRRDVWQIIRSERCDDRTPNDRIVAVKPVLLTYEQRATTLAI